MSTSPARLLITCEHGGNRVPARYRRLFAGHASTLGSHRGWDPGALEVARDVARALGAPLVSSMVTRLVVDLNRSVGHRQVFSEVTRGLGADERARILRSHHRPYRAQVESAVEAMVATGARVIHLSSHSFTPVLEGDVRRAEIGLLYDPTRAFEPELAARWRDALREARPGWRVRRNYPYRGDADGLTTHLRRRFAARDYVGVELEVNQALVREGGAAWRHTRAVLVDTLRAVLRSL